MGEGGGRKAVPPGAPGGPERLQKLLARAGVASRRAAEALIRAGRVRLNGEPVTELGVRADPARDVITVDGRPLGPPPPPAVYLLNKPAGVVTTMRDPQGRPTVAQLARAAGIAERVYPVGRLDADTEGLLLLTNDGDLAYRLTHPRYAVPRTYEARVEGVPGPAALGRLRAGVVLDDGPTAPAGAELVAVTPGGAAAGGPTAVLRITIHEGRKRQVRRMCAAVGHPVVQLRRVRLGPLALGDLAPGAVRRLDDAEVQALRAAAGGPSGPGVPAPL